MEKTHGETRYPILFKKRGTKINFLLLNPFLPTKVLSN